MFTDCCCTDVIVYYTVSIACRGRSGPPFEWPSSKRLPQSKSCVPAREEDVRLAANDTSLCRVKTPRGCFGRFGLNHTPKSCLTGSPRRSSLSGRSGNSSPPTTPDHICKWVSEIFSPGPGTYVQGPGGFS
eukprot:16015527-Heterocapsa_arctica.AAC.1